MSNLRSEITDERSCVDQLIELGARKRASTVLVRVSIIKNEIVRPLQAKERLNIYSKKYCLIQGINSLQALAQLEKRKKKAT